MNPRRFDHLAFALGRRTPRRSLVGLLAAMGVTGLLARDVAAATCRPDGTRCGGSTGVTYCSGSCKTQHGSHKKVCRPAPSQGTCTIERTSCGNGLTGDCSVAGTPCTCFVTSSGRSFCGELLKVTCTASTTDEQCTEQTGKGSACITTGPTCCTTTSTFGATCLISKPDARHRPARLAQALPI